MAIRSNNFNLKGVGKIMLDSEITHVIKVRATVNKWITNNFKAYRKYIGHHYPDYDKAHKLWKTDIVAEKTNKRKIIGSLTMNEHLDILYSTDKSLIIANLESILDEIKDKASPIQENSKSFIYFGDGIEAAKRMNNKSIDLLLTDPPYLISQEYTCEKQIKRRLRKNGKDFIMPKGNFGDWDYDFNPKYWCDIVLPKVKGWSVIFCSHEQIGTYSNLLRQHSFNSVGTFVWQKTNPVPFNHKFKPVNAWEAVVVGKRPSSKFYGELTHNVFKCQSPSPQHRIHPTQKPIPLIKHFIELFSQRDDVVFDPFTGSGTTPIVANYLSRQVIAYENNKEHYVNAMKRFNSGIVK